LAYNSTSFPSLLIIFPNFVHSVSYTTWTTPLFYCKYPSMCVHTSHRPIGYPPLMLCSWQQTHGNPWCSSWHICYHCVTCWLPYGMKITICTAFNRVQFLSLMGWHCPHQRWHLHFNQLNADRLLLRSCTIQRFAPFDVIQVKKRSYCN